MRRRGSLERAKPARSPKRKFIIYSEGKNTEPLYFRTLRRDLLGALVDIEIVDAAGVPLTLAKSACSRAQSMKRRHKQKSSFDENDQVWAVFDRDEHPKVSEAIDRCRQSGVQVAFSDPCFELWLILHLTDFDRADDRHQVQAELEKLCPGYCAKGSKTGDFSQLMAFVVEAEERAERQLHNREQEGIAPGPPFTTVFRLTREMRAAHEAYQGIGGEK